MPYLHRDRSKGNTHVLATLPIAASGFSACMYEPKAIIGFSAAFACAIPPQRYGSGRRNASVNAPKSPLDALYEKP